MDKYKILEVANIIMAVGSGCLAIINAITATKREEDAIEKAVLKVLGDPHK